MNRFLTSLFAASCLAAVGQVPEYVPDSVLIDEGWSLVLEREGQQYWLFDEDREWEDARAMCEELGAYLYWPNDDNEHQAIWDLLPHGDDGVQFWTAIHQDSSIVSCNSEDDGGWVGPNGLLQIYLPWYSSPNGSEPNNGSNGESVVQFEWSIIGSAFNDAPGQSGCDGYSNCQCRFARVILERSIVCSDAMACNYNESEPCHYDCNFCLEGTIWSEDLGGCIVANPSDSNFDGCVQLNDLLDLLSAYGDCGAEESPWQCGDPLEYQGYDYATVQIGEQCWFAENLRAENYRNGDAVTSELSDLDWSGATYGAVAVFGEGESSCSHDSPEGDACLPSWSISQFGRLYNWYAVNDERALCKTGWHVPSDEDWIALEMTLGMSEVLANSSYYRGTQEGRFLKDSMGWSESNNGNNSSGFTGKPAGYRMPNGDFDYAGYDLGMWSSTPADDNKAMRRNLTAYPDFKDLINRGPVPRNYGLSVRCVTDVY